MGINVSSSSNFNVFENKSDRSIHLTLHLKSQSTKIEPLLKRVLLKSYFTEKTLAFWFSPSHGKLGNNSASSFVPSTSSDKKIQIMIGWIFWYSGWLLFYCSKKLKTEHVPYQSLDLHETSDFGALCYLTNWHFQSSWYINKKFGRLVREGCSVEQLSL